MPPPCGLAPAFGDHFAFSGMRLIKGAAPARMDPAGRFEHDTPGQSREDQPTASPVTSRDRRQTSVGTSLFTRRRTTT